jgi:hypothetical protein
MIMVITATTIPNKISPNEAMEKLGNIPPFDNPPFEIMDEIFPINEMINTAYSDAMITGAITNINADVMPNFLPVSRDILLTFNCYLSRIRDKLFAEHILATLKPFYC